MNKSKPITRQQNHNFNHHFQTILITCIDARHKCLDGLGDLKAFDLILDATELVQDRNHYEFRPEFGDRISEVIFIDTLADARDFFSKREIRRAIIYSPPIDISRIEPLLSLLKKHGIQCDVAINKTSMKRLIPLPGIRYISRKIKGALLRATPLKIDTLFYPNRRHLPQWARVLSPKRLQRVRHMDAPRHEKQRGEFNLLLDSYLPFHREYERFNQPLDAETFYKRVRDFSELVKQETGVDRFIISLHPNSHLKETPHLDGVDWDIGNTNSLISRAHKVWSFGSESTGTAVCYEKEVEYLNFPDLLAPQMQEYIRTKGKAFGISVIEYDGQRARRINPLFLTRKAKLAAYRQTYGMDAPLLSEAIHSRTR